MGFLLPLFTVDAVRQVQVRVERVMLGRIPMGANSNKLKDMQAAVKLQRDYTKTSKVVIMVIIKLNRLLDTLLVNKDNKPVLRRDIKLMPVVLELVPLR